MGKGEDEQTLPSSTSTDIRNANRNADIHRCPKISFKCVIVLVFGLAVFISAVFLLPPFVKQRDRVDLDLASLLRAHHVAVRIKLRRPVSVLKQNIQQLQADIFDEIGVPNSTVAVILLDPDVSNATDVVFAVDPDMKSSNIPSASLSLLKSSFVSLVLRQSSFHLTPSLFGDPISFGVLKFEGGISVTPTQNAFLLQKAQALFNFTLNFSIHQIQENFEELKNQLKSGLHLTLYENLYINLRNSYGSTVAPPTTVQVSVLLAIGNLPPPMPRLKQLAQTITGSPARNLGLNHTEFGKVKQVRLSSVLEHSLNSDGSSGTSGSPSPAPVPMPHGSHPRHHHHHHHHQAHHHHHHDFDQASAPAPEKSYRAKSPSGCQIGFHGKNKGQHRKAPAVAPVVSPHPSAASPHSHVDPPASASHLPPASSPLPSVSADAHPPNKKTPAVEPSNITPSISPLPASSTAEYYQFRRLSSVKETGGASLVEAMRRMRLTF